MPRAAQPDLFSFMGPTPPRTGDVAKAPAAFRLTPPAPIAHPARMDAPRLPSLSDLRGMRPAAWRKLIADDAMVNGVRLPVEILVCRAWTRVVIEDLSHPAHGRHMLHNDGQIIEYARDGAPYVRIFMTADEARSVHVAWPLMPIAVTPGATRLRVAAAGEDAPLVLSFPEGS